MPQTDMDKSLQKRKMQDRQVDGNREPRENGTHKKRLRPARKNNAKSLVTKAKEISLHDQDTIEINMITKILLN